MNNLEPIGIRARAASVVLYSASTEQKNTALEAIARALEDNIPAIITANDLDLINAEKNNMAEAMRDRLRLDKGRIMGIAKAVRQIAALRDPIGEIIGGQILPNGLRLEKVRTPLGVIGIIFESRPNVTVDAACLCLKSSNVCILRGGKEAINSNIALTQLMRSALVSAGLPADCVQLVEDTSRQSATELMSLTGYIDVLIPRGGKGLIRSVVENAKVPVIETGAGNCHIFVDASADLDMAVNICDNAKTSRPSVCNAVETVLVHMDIAQRFIPLLRDMLNEHNVELRGCPRTMEILKNITAAKEEDWSTEYDDYILALRIVDSLDEAMEHIRRYSTGHSESIVTMNFENARRFTTELDSAALYVNASTRFTDGGEFGFGAEIGISTQKLHARGPMGLTELTSMKYIVTGTGQIR